MLNPVKRLQAWYWARKLCTDSYTAEKNLKAIPQYAVPQLVGMIKTANNDLKRQICMFLENYGSAVPVKTTPAMLDFLRDSNPNNQSDAIRFLRNVANDPRVIPALIEVHNNQQNEVFIRADAATALGHIGSEFADSASPEALSKAAEAIVTTVSSLTKYPKESSIFQKLWQDCYLGLINLGLPSINAIRQGLDFNSAQHREWAGYLLSGIRRHHTKVADDRLFSQATRRRHQTVASEAENVAKAVELTLT